LGRKAIADKEPEVTAAIRELVDKLTLGNADPNLFTAEMRADSFSARTERVARLLKSLGPITKMDLVERSDKDGARVYGYQISFQNGSRFLKLSMTTEKKIAELAFVDDF
jgi:hypothetical protein